MSSLRLNADGPRSDGYTREVANGLYECVRVLNHATQSEHGLPYPSTVYDVLGSAHAAICGLDQLMLQLGSGLSRQQATGRLGHDFDDPAAAVAIALERLAESRVLATALAERIYLAFNETAGLNMRGGGEN